MVISSGPLGGRSSETSSTRTVSPGDWISVGDVEGKVLQTTPGRMILRDIVPRQIPFEMINLNMDKKAVANLVAAGVPTAVAAGNESKKGGPSGNACNYSPASVEKSARAGS